MEELSLDNLIILYQCMLNVLQKFKINNYIKVFYCGKSLCWGNPSRLLIIVKENEYYFDEWESEFGIDGKSYLDELVVGSHWHSRNDKYFYHYKIISNTLFNKLNNDWNNLIINESWIYPGIDITKKISKIEKIKAFI